MCFAWLRNLLCKDLSEEIKELNEYHKEEIKELNDYHKEEIKELNETLNYYEGGPTPKTSGTISYDSLKELFEGKTKHLFLSDAEYKLVSYDSMKEFLDWDRTDREKWTMTWRDCDDFSYRLMGQASTPEWASIAFGIAWSKTHAFNVFVSEDRIPFIIEPQTDKIIKLEEAQGAYADLQLVLI